MYNIAIIEDDLSIRKGLSEYFEQSKQISCVLAVDTVEKFIKFHRDFLDIHLILLDVMLYKNSSIPDIPMILQREPEAQIIMFTILDETDTIFQALCKGATGYLLKDADYETLEQQLCMTLKGEGALLSPAIAKKIIKHFTPSSKSIVDKLEANVLTEKEAFVIELLKKGHSYKEIASHFGISINGVRYYVKNVYRKLQINRKMDLWKLDS